MSFWRSKKGAVLAEFAIAFMPVCTLFLVLMEVTRYSMARMAMEHAAGVSVRACSVIQTPQNQGTANLDGDPGKDMQTAAEAALEPWKKTKTLTSITATCDPPGGRNSTDTATVEADYHCDIPVAGKIVCGFGGKKKMTLSARMAHQGADYVVE